MNTGVNSQYNIAAADSLPVRLAGRQRRAMYARFLAALAPGETDTILDVGTTSDQDYDHSNYVLAWYPHKARLTAVGLDDTAALAGRFPGVTFRQGDGRALPFDDASFDYVHSSAVLEHVGSRDDQIRFVGEMWRVARKGIFLTTPNRWFPVEFHTILPLLHWLPRPLHRRLLNALNLGFFASEQNLHLLSARDLASVARRAQVQEFHVSSVALAGWPSNLLLAARKSSA